MWIRIRAVIIEDEPLAAEYLAALLDDTYQVEVVGIGTESEEGLRLCADLRPDAVFLDINLPGKDGVSLATQLAMLPQPPHLVFTTGNAGRATDAFRLDAVDYLLKPLDPDQITESVNRLLAHLRPFESASLPARRIDSAAPPNKAPFTGGPSELLPVKDVDRDQIRLLARREVALCCDGIVAPGCTRCGRNLPLIIPWPISSGGSAAIRLSRSEGMPW